MEMVTLENVPGTAEKELFERACRAYFRRFGREASQPSWAESVASYYRHIGFGGITLSNANGHLATYLYNMKKDRLKFVH
jgi:hypothetical protein